MVYSSNHFPKKIDEETLEANKMNKSGSNSKAVWRNVQRDTTRAGNEVWLYGNGGGQSERVDELVGDRMSTLILISFNFNQSQSGETSQSVDVYLANYPRDRQG